MRRVHTVKQGECLSSIAERFGFPSYKAIYEHADNAELRKKRPDPAVLFPGDEIVIPAARAKTVSLATGKVHEIRVKRAKARLRLVLHDAEGGALANQRYAVRVEGKELMGSTAEDGLLDEEIPATAGEAELEVPSVGLTMRIRLGHLDPASTVEGAQRRLNNLGFGAGAVDGVCGPRTRAAIGRFRQSVGLSAGDELDTETGDALVRAHGS